MAFINRLDNEPSTRQERMRERTSNQIRRPAARRTHDYDEFRETLAPSMTRLYDERDASEIETASTGERVVRFVATLANVLLGIRFVTDLFTTDTANPVVGFFHAATNWLIAPFQALVDTVTPTTGGFVNVPAVIAVVVVSLVATILGLLMRAAAADRAARDL